MNRSDLTLTFRSLKKNLLYSFLVIAGLSVGIAVLLFTMQWSAWHFTFDRTYRDYRQIYRLTLEENKENFHRHMARVIHGDIIRSITFSDAFSKIENIGRLSPYRKAIIKLGRDEFYENYAYRCDADWLRIFSPTVISGSINDMLAEPYTAVITKSIAQKYFGSEDPIGKTFEIIHQFDTEPVDFTVNGVIEDFPENSHLKISILTSIENPIEFEQTAWTYLKLKKNVSVSELEENLKLYIDANFEPDYVEKITPRLQAISEIHLHSHKPREIVPNVQFKSVIILLITGLFVFILSWFNFTLLSVSQHQLNVKRLVIQWQMGAGRKELFNQFLVDNLIIGTISLVTGLILTFILRNRLALITDEQIFHNEILIILIILFLVLLLFISAYLTAFYSTHRLYRYLRFKYLSAKSTTPPDAALKNHFIRWVIISEFIITFILITNLYMIQKQTAYATSMQMGADDPETIQIPNLHRKIIDQYAVFREKMMASPQIDNVTGTMEEPTGLTMDAVEFSIDGIEENEERLYLFPVEENFTRFYNIKVLYGEDLPASYNPNDTFEYFVLNETAARMIAGMNLESLIGRKITLDFFYPGLIGPGRIGGIVEDFYLSGLDYEISPMVMFPKHIWLYCFSVRIKGDHKAAEAYLKQVWDDLFPDYPLRYYYTQDLINEYYKSEITEIKIRMVFSIISILIATTGLFALSGFFMNRKLKYAAIRKIHGAGILNIMLTEMLYYLYIALISSAIAVLPSYFLIERWLRNFFYKLPVPISLFVICALCLVIFSWISVFYHTWKLAKMNPADVLHE